MKMQSLIGAGMTLSVMMPLGDKESFDLNEFDRS